MVGFRPHHQEFHGDQCHGRLAGRAGVRCEPVDQPEYIRVVGHHRRTQHHVVQQWRLCAGDRELQRPEAVLPDHRVVCVVSRQVEAQAVVHPHEHRDHAPRQHPAHRHTLNNGPLETRILDLHPRLDSPPRLLCRHLPPLGLVGREILPSGTEERVRVSGSLECVSVITSACL